MHFFSVSVWILYTLAAPPLEVTGEHLKSRGGPFSLYIVHIIHFVYNIALLKAARVIRNTFEMTRMTGGGLHRHVTIKPCRQLSVIFLYPIQEQKRHLCIDNGVFFSDCGKEEGLFYRWILCLLPKRLVLCPEMKEEDTVCERLK